MLLNLQLYCNLIQYLPMYSSKPFVQRKKKKKEEKWEKKISDTANRNRWESTDGDKEEEGERRRLQEAEQQVLSF